MVMTQEYWWKISLRLKLRQSSGDAFQDFFSTVMEKLHGNDFVRVRPFGRKGDKGCDGYLKSSGNVYQCYGALGGSKDKVDYLIGKMDEDFEKAKEYLSGIMTKWHMVHNLVDGLPVEAVQKLQELEPTNPDVEFGFMGLEGFEESISQLEQSVVEQILGPSATNDDAQNMQVAELRDLVRGVVKGIDQDAAPTDPITPVPVDKLGAYTYLLTPPIS